MALSGQIDLENWNQPEKPIDFFFVKKLVHRLLVKLQFNLDELQMTTVQNSFFKEGLTYSYRNKTLVEFGELSQTLLKSMDIKQKVFAVDFNWEHILKLSDQHDVKMEELVKFPVVRRDLALVVDKKVSFADIEAIARKTEKNILKSVGLFDVYEGKPLDEDKKSYSVNFFLQDKRNTLNEKQIDKLMSRLIQLYESELGALIRR